MLQFPCRFASKVCPLRLYSCEWSGRHAELMTHCLKTHPRNIYRTSSQELLVEKFNDLEDRQYFILFNVYDSWFRFTWSLDSNTRTLLFAMYRLGTKPTQMKFGYEVKFVHPTEPGNEIVLMDFCQRLEDQSVILMPDKPISADYDVLLIIAMKLETSATMSTFLGRPMAEQALIQSVDDAELEKAIIAKFACPSCDKYIYPPIGQCRRGHAFCPRCFNRMNRCIFCLSTKSRTKCTVLEKINDLLQFPCRFANRGCTFTSKSSTIADHEVHCEHSVSVQQLRMEWTPSSTGVSLSQYAPMNIYFTVTQQLLVQDFTDLRDRQFFMLFNVFDSWFRCSIIRKLENKALQWFGHVQRMQEHRWPKRVLEWELPGRRRRGRPPLRWETYSGMIDTDLRVGDWTVRELFNWALDSNTGTLLFSMYRLGTKPTQVKFGYEIKVTHPTRHGQRMVLRGSCHRLEDEGVVFMPDKHIYADYDVLIYYCDEEGDLHYSVTIYRKSVSLQHASGF
nr:unnamed protein product [Callosobruchus chinensis]